MKIDCHDNEVEPMKLMVMFLDFGSYFVITVNFSKLIMLFVMCLRLEFLCLLISSKFQVLQCEDMNNCIVS